MVIEKIIEFLYKLLLTVCILFAMLGLMINYGLWGLLGAPAMALAISWLWDRGKQ